MTDEDAVARLEALVQSQRPATAPWQPVTDYSFEARRLVEGQHPDLIVSVFGKVPILDWGCGPDAILVRLLRERGAMAYGYDPILKPEWKCFEPLRDTDFAAEPFRITDAYQLIICREVMEHLPLREIQSLVRRFVSFRPRFLYITTRFAHEPDHLLDVDTVDDLDPTHCTMLTKPFLRTLFVLEGCRSRPDLEARMDWQQKGRCLVFEVPQ